MKSFFVKKWLNYFLNPRNLLTLQAEADVDQFMLEGHKFPRFAKVRMFLVLTSHQKRCILKIFCLLVSGSGKVC